MPIKSTSKKSTASPRRTSAEPSQVKKTPPRGAAQYFYANGKRKTSVARVRLYAKGTGKITVNGHDGIVYFPLDIQQHILRAPFRLTNNVNVFDYNVKVTGGGKMSQCEAVRHGISKALLEYDPSLRLTLKRVGFLTRDSRVKERKKYGLKRARRAPQFSKR